MLFIWIVFLFDGLSYYIRYRLYSLYNTDATFKHIHLLSNYAKKLITYLWPYSIISNSYGLLYVSIKPFPDNFSKSSPTRVKPRWKGTSSSTFDHPLAREQVTCYTRDTPLTCVKHDFWPYKPPAVFNCTEDKPMRIILWRIWIHITFWIIYSVGFSGVPI